MIDVSTHSRLKAAGSPPTSVFLELLGFNTQPPEGGWVAEPRMSGLSRVSTHSRLKAAGSRRFSRQVGCQKVSTHSRLKAAGWTPQGEAAWCKVSTHSRLKAAGLRPAAIGQAGWFQHTAA